MSETLSFACENGIKICYDSRMEIDEKIKIAAPEIKALIDQSQKILLACHPRADFDSVGSVLALGQVLISLGKEVTMIVGDTPLPKFAAFYPGSERILPQNFSQTDITRFDLFIALDVSSLRRVSELEEIIIPPDLKTILIDHHRDGELFGQISLVLPEAPATGEILYQLFSAWGIPMSPAVALCLMLALYGDTGGFRYASTSSRTFMIASELIKLAPDYFKIINELENSEQFERVLFRAIGVSKAERFFAGKLIVAAIDRNDLEQSKIELEEVANSGLVSVLRSVAGCVVSVSLVEEGPGQIKFSGRSRDSELCDVSKMAVHFGGGGHRVAAGATIKGKTLDEVKKEVIDWFEHNC
jgi:phosphoesterase RecJ-like protein